MGNWAEDMFDKAHATAKAMVEAKNNPITIDDVMEKFRYSVKVNIAQNEIILMLVNAIRKHEDEYPLYGRQDPENCDIKLWAAIEAVDAITKKHFGTSWGNDV